MKLCLWTFRKICIDSLAVEGFLRFGFWFMLRWKILSNCCICNFGARLRNENAELRLSRKGGVAHLDEARCHSFFSSSHPVSNTLHKQSTPIGVARAYLQQERGH